MHRLRVSCSQRLHHLLDGESRLHDILYDDDGAACQVLIDANHLFHLSCRGSALIGSQFHEGNLKGDGKFTHEVGSKDECPIENSQEQRIFPIHVFADSLGQCLYSLFDNILRD